MYPQGRIPGAVLFRQFPRLRTTSILPCSQRASNDLTSGDRMRLSLLTALLLPLASLACGRQQPISDPARPLEVSRGERFTLSLASNQSTGYRWVLLDSATLKRVRMLGSEYRSRAPQRNGAGGIERWSFVADSAGSAVISLVYVRPWEHTAPPDTTRFHVTIR
jgi:inhibitor of cysteine peptidase